MINKGQGWFQIEVEVKKEGLRIPARVNFKKENNEYVMNQTRWIDSYDPDAEELKTMSFKGY